MTNEPVTVITGATSDIGTAIAMHLGSIGRPLIITGRDVQKLSTLETQLKKKGVFAASVPANLDTLAGAERFFEQAIKEANRFSGLVHVAGVWHEGNDLLYGPRIDEVEWAQVGRVINVTLLSFLRLAHLMLPHFARDGSGRIVAITGTFSAGASKWAHYYIAKQSLEVVIRALSDEYRELGIRVNAISPADVNTAPMRAHFPDDAISGLKPADVADAVGWLFGPGGQHVSGQTIVLRRRDP